MLRQFQPGQPILHAYILAAADAAVREKESTEHLHGFQAGHNQEGMEALL